MTSTSEEWLGRGIDRCRRALLDATSPRDRVALIRELVRLRHGWCVLASEALALSAEEIRLLSLFGLALATDGRAVRFSEGAEIWAPIGFAQALQLDSLPRSVFTNASPDAVLLRHSNHCQYLSPAQKAAVRAVLTMPHGAGLMVNMATGGGKSLLFQLYSKYLRSQVPGACVAVITPTVALALDHVRTLSKIPGLEGSRALTGDLQNSERDELLSAFRRGDVPVLFLSPEFALGQAREALIEAVKKPEAKYGLEARLAALFIDEAHIVESWGRSFRPDFQRLPSLLRDLRVEDSSLRTVLLSATLPLAAKRELRRAYGVSGLWLEIDARTARYEHDVVVQSYASERARSERFEHLINWVPRPAIVYTTRVDTARELYDELKRCGHVRLALFTGDTNGMDRKRIVSDWADNRLDVVVATSAFGLGVDKADVRSVVHMCLPESPARWYQEIGRAARDGHQGLAVCLFVNDDDPQERSDTSEAFHQAATSWLTRENAESRWRALIEKRVSSSWNGPYQRFTVDLDVLRESLPAKSAGDYNRNWNRSLLTLMQRANVLEIVSISMDGEHPGSLWEVEVKVPGVLEVPATDTWDKVFKVRDEELASALFELEQFKGVMQKPLSQCVLHSAFALMQSEEREDVPFCGRCEWCRRNGVSPPHSVKVHGMEAAWEVVTDLPAAKFPVGFSLVVPEDAEYKVGLIALLRRLARVGFEQFLVPEDISNLVALTLCETNDARFGFVVCHEGWVGSEAQSLARVSTAVLLPVGNEGVSESLRRLRQFSAQAPELSIAVVSRSERRVDDRRLDQTVSRRAPYEEAALDMFYDTGLR